MSNSTKGQVVAEFMAYLGIAMLIFVSMMIFLHNLSQANTEETQYDSLFALGTDVQQSFALISSLDPYVNTTIELPELVNGQNYSIEVLASKLYLQQGDVEVILALPQTTGATTAKVIVIEKTASGVFIS